MECPSKYQDATELTIAYIEGSLDPVTERAFECHRQTCARCRELIEAQQELWTALDSWTPRSISSDFDQRLYQRLAADESVAPKWWRSLGTGQWSRWPAMSLAATACAGLAVALLFLSPKPAPVSPSRNSAQIHAPAIEQVESALDDIDMLKQLGLPSSTSSKREKL